MSSVSPLVVFSHLRWDFVFQRPQHLLTRLARTRPVIFIEEPLEAPDGRPVWRVRTEAGVTICQPLTPRPAHGFTDDQVADLVALLPSLPVKLAPESFDLWLYTPMAWPVARTLVPRVTVYDCMDELSAFHNAPPKLLEREQQLLNSADVVFTGGPSLFNAKKHRHANAHCFSSSVDAAHFGKAKAKAAEPADQKSIPHPRLGFFGVVDERFDRDLLAAIAAARPSYHFVVVGPVVKIDAAALPRAANIHYLGQKSYAELPAYLAGWDVALLPFARNDATKFISPTKTLEYMAAGKPIVSTPITDVAEPYGTMVGLGSTPSEFLAACDRAVNETANERAVRLAKFDQVLASTSWDRTAKLMARAIESAAHTETFMDSSIPVAVVGAGPTGLSAAYHLGDKALLIEAEDRIGGWCRSVVDKGFTFDYAGHIMFSNDPYVHQLYKMLLGDNVHWQDREAWVYSKNVHTRYPFQGALYGLPADVIKECIVGAVEARYGKTDAKPDNKPAANGTGNGAVNAKNGPAKPAAGVCLPGNDPKDLADCCGDGVAEATVPLVQQIAAEADKPAGPRNFEEFIYQVWGVGIAKHFAVPYNKKIWAVPLDQMETSWLGGRVPMPDLGEMIEGALTPKPKPMGPNARFGYPLKGGFQALMDGFLPHLKGQVRTSTRITKVSPTRHELTLDDGSVVRYEQLVSTMPLPELVKMMGSEAPADVQAAAKKLRYTSVRCVNIGVGREKLTEKHWIYYPEDTVFHRVFVQGNASPHCNPDGGFGLTCEITYGPLKPLPCDGDALVNRCVAECVQVGLMRSDDVVLASNQVDMPYAYVVYDHARAGVVAHIRDWLTKHDVILAGRYSEWEYYNSDHAFLAGKKAADTALAKLAPSVPASLTQRAAAVSAS